jgi:hypothetical protein
MVEGARVVLRAQAEKQGAPKLSAALIFLCLLSLHQGKESKKDFCQDCTTAGLHDRKTII